MKKVFLIVLLPLAILEGFGQATNTPNTYDPSYFLGWGNGDPNPLNLKLDGINRLKIFDDPSYPYNRGFIGIGDFDNTDPTSQLHLNNNNKGGIFALFNNDRAGVYGNEYGFLIGLGGGGDELDGVLASQSGGIKFFTRRNTPFGSVPYSPYPPDPVNGNMRMYLSPKGNFGVNSDDPKQKVHVNGSILIDGTQATMLFGGETSGALSSGEYGIEYIDGTSPSIEHGLNFWKPWGSHDGSGGTAGYRNYILFMNNDGKIGVGTNLPSQKFQIDNGNAMVRGNANFASASDEAMLYLGDNNNFIKAKYGTGVTIGAYTAPNALTVNNGGVVNVNNLSGAGIRMVVTDATGNLSSQAIPTVGSGDNLGNHSASQNINMNSYLVNGTSGIGFANGKFLDVTGSELWTNSYIGINGISSPFYALDVWGDCWSSGTWIDGSDRRFKKDIQSLESNLSKFMKLKPAKYYYNTEEFPKITKDESQHFGFIAQEIQEIYPNLVVENNKGLLGVKYIEIIPIAVAAIQEQQNIIDEQNQRINLLEQKVTDLGSTLATCCSSMRTIDNPNNATEVASLIQNKPNPFSEKTTIRYFIPSDFKYAEINVYNLNGEKLKRYKINAIGNGEVIFDGKTFNAGTYVYSLSVDGIQVDSKWMTLTK